MSLKRIRAILAHELYITKHSYELINDLFLYPLWSIIIFGFMTIYIVGSGDQIIGKNVLLGIILWQIVNLVQYSISIGCLWDIWARNLTNIFITPISIGEYFTAYSLSGVVKAIIIMILASLLAYFVFKFNILSLGLANLLLIFVNLAFFAISFGIIVLGLLFRFGTKIQAFTWGLLTVFQPLMAVIYPVRVLPEPFRSLAYFFPPTYIFEAARYNLENKATAWSNLFIAFILNLIFFLLAIYFFKLMFNKSKDLGKFARLEG
ncbi:hypothetical protein A2954_04270 [Candidatus Roizmanbacteria bacterium RIFCSPLOWO2_01_FULL_37_12]|uniref:Transport permease protein n=1 Tax=Candidatus Roizmanbacteria bacterium RIFCSPLOWO2_01_FULL_37_12 TaxID=1802056 RepID=A0A1F7IFQ2_9BACT|nr:MAG: hypothetical protein A3D76_06180 [Candidatus Roizmanbacteria bacterium RIFCSPHIGHO2_02_FULL_37_9b]OGK42199.1 MAG: hypothetical protein A2954_04270 [Candidatus Roizmanbacteria bacterium RIFCSPLOWO2_01_FULL_37_12]